MTRIVTALFETYDDAAEAVRRLEAAGMSYREISLIANEGENRHVVQMGTTDDASRGAGTGLGVGAALGGGAGLLAGLGIVAIPGLGPMVAAGWLAAAATGAAAGATTGGIVGALAAAGLSDEDAEIHARGLSRGSAIVTVRASEEQVGAARAILSESKAADIRASGAQSLDPPPLRAAGAHGPERGTQGEGAHASEAGRAEDVAATSKTAGPARADPIPRSNPSVHRLISSDRVRGTSVYDRNGKHIGAVERLMIDKATGQVAHVVMSFGGFLGMGADAGTIAWEALEYDVYLEGYRADMLEDQVRGGP